MGARSRVHHQGLPRARLTTLPVSRKLSWSTYFLDTGMAAGKREQVLRAARALIHRRGFQRTSLADIAQESGLPVGNLYYYFKRKDHILSAITHDWCEHFSARTAAWEREHPRARDRIMEFLSLATGLRGEMAAFGCPVGSLLQELAKEPDDPEAGAAALRDSRRMLELQVSWLETQFETAGHANPRDLALHMITRLQGAILMANTLGEPAIMDREIGQLRAWIAHLEP